MHSLLKKAIISMVLTSSPISYAKYSDSVAVFPWRVEFTSEIIDRPGLLCISKKGLFMICYALEEDYLSSSLENLPTWECSYFGIYKLVSLLPAYNFTEFLYYLPHRINAEQNVANVRIFLQHITWKGSWQRRNL